MKRWAPLIILLVLIAVGGVAILRSREGKPAVPLRDDSQLFSDKVIHFKVLEEIALEALAHPDSVSREAYVRQLQKTALIDWVECVNLMDEAAKLKLDKQDEQLRRKMREYADLRIAQTRLYIKSEQEGGRKYDNSIDSINYSLSILTEELEQKTDADEERQVLPLKNL